MNHGKPVAPFVLYGAECSYYTAKLRSYLRKKGIPFVERLPREDHYRDVVRPAVGTYRIPVIAAADDRCIQDTAAIVDALEPHYPEPAAVPSTPRQHVVARLLELIAGEYLLKAAMQFRWNHPRQNRQFIVHEFGQLYRLGDAAAIQAKGSELADRMRQYLPGLGVVEATQEAIEEGFWSLLALFERHLQDHPYVLGGIPSLADYSLMGPLYAHIARDPYSGMLLKQRAPG
ncbi:MAG: glutathione S-transferase N-terminal domain-containing protein [Pseudomonadota bacterium]